MPKIYPDKPESGQKHDVQPEKKTAGVYDKPNRRGPYKGLIVAIVIIILIVIAFLVSSGFAQAGMVSGWGSELALASSGPVSLLR